MDSSCLLIKLGIEIAIIAIYRPHAFKNTDSLIKSLNNVIFEL